MKLKVRGQDLSRLKTHVYFNKALVMTALRTDGHRSFTELEWEVGVTRGLDVSLVRSSSLRIELTVISLMLLLRRHR